MSAEVAARRREWRERDADRCARHAANALAAIAAADPEGRPALTLVPYLLDITLTRAESPASSRATRGAAAGVLFRLAGEPLGKSAIASRPDAVAGLVSLACESSSVSKRPSMNEDGDECAALDAAGALWMATVRVAGAGVNPNTRGDSGVSTPGGGPSAGGSGFSTPGTVSSQALGAAAGNDAAQVICSHLSHHHLDKLASALVNRHRGGRSAEVDDVVVARLATVLANVCAAPACAANVARSPGTLTSVARALASTRPSRRRFRPRGEPVADSTRRGPVALEPDRAERDRACGFIRGQRAQARGGGGRRRGRVDRDDFGRLRLKRSTTVFDPERRRGSPGGRQARRGDAGCDCRGARGEVFVRGASARGSRRALRAHTRRRRCGGDIFDFARRGLAPAQRGPLAGSLRVYRER